MQRAQSRPTSDPIHAREPKVDSAAPAMTKEATEKDDQTAKETKGGDPQAKKRG